MKIELGINPNCSESVSQVCGVHTENIEEFKDRFWKKMIHKYSVDYLNKLCTDLFNINPGDKYCLNLADGNNDWKELAGVAKEMNLYCGSVSCCSDYIDDNESMVNQMEWREKKEEDNNGYDL